LRFAGIVYHWIIADFRLRKSLFASVFVPDAKTAPLLAMSLGPEQVRKIAHLARLELKPGQESAYARQLSDILEMVGALGRADTDQITPMAHPLDMVQRLRPDVITDPVGEAARAAFQAIAPAVSEGLYLVPKVIE
jgi:aspartyl-tRNA(Asn)/glutamyl-tRNA(Gln) amidotransferase subunit C